MNTGFHDVGRGAKTKEEADAAIEFRLAAISMLPGISEICGGLSLFEKFCAVCNVGTVNASSGDYCVVRILYDETKQYTYGQQGEDWILGLMSQQIESKDFFAEQYYKNSDPATYQYKTTIPITQKTANYDSPWQKAYQGVAQMQAYDEWVTWSIGTKTFTFIH